MKLTITMHYNTVWGEDIHIAFSKAILALTVLDVILPLSGVLITIRI